MEQAILISALEAASNGIVVTDVNGDIQWVNQAFCELTGYSCHEVIGINPRVLKSGYQSAQYYEELWATITSGKVWKDTLVNRRKDRTLYHEEMTITPVFGADGKVQNYIAIKQDVSKRVAAKQKLISLNEKATESENQLQAITSQLSDGICVTDMGGNYIYVSPALCQMTGYSEKELLCMSVRDLAARSQKPGHFEQSKTATSGVAGKILLQRKDGSEFYTEIVGKTIEYDGTPHVLGIVRDISQRIEAERKLAENERRYRQIFETNQAIKLLIDPDGGQIIEANQAAVNFYGYTREELLKLKISDINTLSRTAVQEEMDRARTEDRLFFQFRHRLASGEIRDVEVYSGPFKVEGKDFLYSIIIDVTVKKRAERELEILNRELEQRVSERTKELESFAYSVSHDLRAPVRAIAGFSSILLSDHTQAFDNEGYQMLHRINAAAYEMNALINGMLDLSRMNRRDVALVPVDLELIAQEVFDEQCSTFDLGVSKIKFQSSAVPQIFADHELSKILLTNLISNAIKFSSNHIQIPTVEFGLFEVAERPVFYLKDNGVGFNMEYVDKVFLPFQRLHNKNEFEGTGIGLAIVQRIVQRHNGEIRVESEIGQGTTFYFSLGQVCR